MSMWSAFALWASATWQRMPGQLRAAGASLLSLVGIAIGSLALLLPKVIGQIDGSSGDADTRWTTLRALQYIPSPAWLALRPMFAIIGLALITFSLLAIYFISTRQPKLACTALAAAMIPTGLSMIDGVARMAPRFSDSPRRAIWFSKSWSMNRIPPCARATARPLQVSLPARF